MADVSDPRPRRLLVPVLLAGIVGLVAWLLLRDTASPGVVAGMRWSHTTQLQRWQDVSRSDWRENLVFRAGVPPVRGLGEVAAVLVTQCTPKAHHEETHECGVETFTRREPYHCGDDRKCKRVREGRGKDARVVEHCEDIPRKCFRDIPEDRPKICTRTVHADWCEYLTQEWVPVRSERIEGDAHQGLRFPELPAASDSERTQQSAAYSLTFSYAGGEHTAVVPKNEYDQWNIGDPVVLSTEAVGGVLGFARPTATPR